MTGVGGRLTKVWLPSVSVAWLYITGADPVSTGAGGLGIGDTSSDRDIQGDANGVCIRLELSSTTDPWQRHSRDRATRLVGVLI